MSGERAGGDDLPVVLQRLPRPAAGDVLPGADLAGLAADAPGRLLLRQLPLRRPARTSPTGWPPRARRSSTASAGSPPRTGAPLIDGVLGYVDCTIDRVHEAGDHYIVVGRVQELAFGDGRTERASTGRDTAAVPPRRLHATGVVVCAGWVGMTVPQRVRRLARPTSPSALLRRFLLLCESPRTRRRALALVRGSVGNARAGKPRSTPWSTGSCSTRSPGRWAWRPPRSAWSWSARS